MYRDIIQQIWLA